MTDLADESLRHLCVLEDEVIDTEIGAPLREAIDWAIDFIDEQTEKLVRYELKKKGPCSHCGWEDE